MTVDEVAKNTKEEGRSSRRQRNRETAANAVSQGQRKDRPTPTRREGNGKGNFVTRIFRTVSEYFGSTKAELQKVTWPTRQESIRLSGIVIAVTIIFSIGLGTLDYLYGALFRLGFDTPVIFIIFAAALVVVVGGFAVAGRRRSGL